MTPTVALQVGVWLSRVVREQPPSLLDQLGEKDVPTPRPRFGILVFRSTRLADVQWCLPKLTVRGKHLAGSKTLRHATVRALAL